MSCSVKSQFHFLRNTGLFSGSAVVGRRPSSLEADGVISLGLGEETRTNRIALAGTAPHPPRSLSTVVSPHKSMNSGDPV
jgi:hypothetical protein